MESDRGSRATAGSSSKTHKRSAPFDQIGKALEDQVTFFQTLIDAVPDPIFYKDSNGLYIGCNRAFETYHGVARAQLVGKSVNDILPEEHARTQTAINEKVLCQGGSQICEATTVRADGETRNILMHKAAFHHKNGAVAGLIGIVRDITDWKVQDEQIRAERRKFQALSEYSPFGIVMMDRHKIFTYVNPEFTLLLGYELPDVPDARTWLEKAFPDPEYRREVIAAYEKSFRESGPGGKAEKVCTVTCRDSSCKKVSIRTVRLENGEYIATYEDVTERIRHEEQLAYMASHDPLTGLPNRRYLEDTVLRAVAHARRGQRSALLFMDLDNFKSVNDTLGHGVGDQVLLVLTGLLRAQLRTEDILARVGGDEFAVLLEGTEYDEACVAADRMRQAIESHPFVLSGLRFCLSLSIGLVEADGSLTTTELLSRADMAMYKAKQQGKNRVVPYGQAAPHR